MMRGPKGSEIVLSIGRPGNSEPFDVTLVRNTIKVASVRQRLLEPGYGYIRIAQFQSSTGADVKKSLDKLLSKGELKGLVLDLRNNPGGILRASVDVASLFMDEGNVVYTEGRVSGSDTRYDAAPLDATDGAPIVVLINQGSASASEIVAGALQDHSRAVIMGTQSFGKGSVQSVLPMSDSRAIKLTTACILHPMAALFRPRESCRTFSSSALSLRPMTTRNGSAKRTCQATSAMPTAPVRVSRTSSSKQSYSPMTTSYTKLLPY